MKKNGSRVAQNMWILYNIILLIVWDLNLKKKFKCSFVDPVWRTNDSFQNKKVDGSFN